MSKFTGNLPPARQTRRSAGPVMRSVRAAGPAVAFSHDADHFLLDGKPFQVLSGELHYFRVPREYWRDRLEKAKALGLNTICTYMPWNLHEPVPGQFDFHGDGGMLDAASFVQLAQDLGLWVILRPGPYICAEWDFGGLPGWLLAEESCRLRCSDDRYVAAVERYITRVGRELAPLSCIRGGPIIMVQVENEYGSYSNDHRYMARVREMLVDAGFNDGLLLFTSDGPEDRMLAGGTLPDTLITVNFGSKPADAVARLKRERANQPVMCGEYWCGWFDWWGKARQGTADPAACTGDIRWMKEHGASFNIYMTHGGTNFGFTAGANHHGPYTPTVTGYDYRALLDEAGRPTEKFHAVRSILGGTGDIPATPTLSIPPAHFHWTGTAPAFANLPAPISTGMPRSMEHYGQYLGGAILYRASVAGLGAGPLTIVEPHDYAIVYVDGKRIGHLDRRLNQNSIEIPAGRILDILVWAFGRVNYGPHLLDRKGITHRVELGHLTLATWDVFPLPMDAAMLDNLSFTPPADTPGPTFHRGHFEVSTPADTFLDLRNWNLGAVWVNGHNLGRYWSIGPQQTLYCPGCWLRKGSNDILIFNLEGGAPKPIAGLDEPILDEVR